MYLNDTEIFRTSTAEPTVGGIFWTYCKDVTPYLATFRSENKIIFDLGNLIDDTYTASYNITLVATFFIAPDDPYVAADLILPISTGKSSLNQPSAFLLPQDNATSSLTIPQNVKKAVVSISACGQSTEEFWWSNVLSSDTETFSDLGSLYGYSPFREVQLYIDGALAGVVWPFPIIFTGGIAPGFWRPLVGIDAFDLREDEIDISPFLPQLCDGSQHTFEIRVSGLSDDRFGSASLSMTVGSYWVVTGKVFIWLDEADRVTTGSTLVRINPNPSIEVSSTIGTDSEGVNETLTYEVVVSRSFYTASNISTSYGSQLVTWHQQLAYTNQGKFMQGGNAQVTDQDTRAFDVSGSGYSKAYYYPLWVFSNFSQISSDIYTIDAALDRGKIVQQTGPAVLPLAYDPSNGPCIAEKTRQNGSASYQQLTNTSLSFGSTEQDLAVSGNDGANLCGPIQHGNDFYHRHVLAANGTVLEDEETNAEVTLAIHHAKLPIRMGQHRFAGASARRIIGRG